MDINVQSVFLNYKNVLLHSAAYSGDHALVHFLLDQCKADPNAVQGTTTPLFVASENGHVEVTKLLIKYGADVNLDHSSTIVADGFRLLGDHEEDSTEAYEVTPLQIAVIGKQLETAKILIENGAKVNIELGVDSGYTPLFSAVLNESFEIAKFLIANGAEIHSQHRETTLLQIACQDRHLDMVKLLVDNGANIHQRSKYGKTNLYIAAYAGNFEIVKFLLELGADICGKTYGDLPIHGVIRGWTRHRDESFMKTLQILATPETVNISGKHRTPLGLAAEKGLIQVVKHLLENGAIPDLSDFQAAKNEQIIKLLKKTTKGNNGNKSQMNKRSRTLSS